MENQHTNVNKKAWGRRLREQMKQKGETQESLAEKCGLTQGMIGFYVRGERLPRLTTLQKIAAILSTTPQWLMYGTPYEISDSQAHYPGQTIKVPIIDWLAITRWQEAIKQPESDYSILANKHVDFGLVVKDDAMLSATGPKSFPPGSIIFVNARFKIESGKFVIALLPNDDEPVFRQYVISGKHFLKPLNPAYPTEQINPKDIEFIGVIAHMAMDI